MSVTKHKVFKVKFSDDGKFTMSRTVEKNINDFLADSNYVYVNHSVTTLTEDIEQYGELKTLCKYVLISIIYKDLNATELDVKKTSQKVKQMVHKEIEIGSEIPEPKIETQIDIAIKEQSKTNQMKKRHLV